MNVYIASFMLLLFNAVGVYMPTANVATETAEGQDASLTEMAQSTVLDDAERVLTISSTITPAWVASAYSAKPIWPVTPVNMTSGDKLEHEEGAP